MRMRVHTDRSRRSYAKARLCSIASRRVASRLRRREGGGSAGGFVQIFRPDRMSLSLHHPLGGDSTPRCWWIPWRSFPVGFFQRDVGTSVVKIFCRDIYGSSPIQRGIKATRSFRTPQADTYFARLFCSRCVTALIIESFAQKGLRGK